MAPQWLRRHKGNPIANTTQGRRMGPTSIIIAKRWRLQQQGYRGRHLEERQSRAAMIWMMAYVSRYLKLLISFMLTLVCDHYMVPIRKFHTRSQAAPLLHWRNMEQNGAALEIIRCLPKKSNGAQYNTIRYNSALEIAEKAIWFGAYPKFQIMKMLYPNHPNARDEVLFCTSEGYSYLRNWKL